MKPTVTVVDDDARRGFAFGVILEEAGLETEWYGSGDDFLGCYAPKPGCVLLDVCMPGTMGPEALAAMNERGWRVPVVAVGIHGFDPLAEACLRRGAVGRLCLPTTGEALVDAVRDALVIDAWRRREDTWRRRGR